MGLIMFAVCRKSDSKYLDFPLNDYYNPYIWSPHKLLPRSLPSIWNSRITLTAKSKHQIQVLQLLMLGNQQIKTEKIILTDKPGMNVFIS